MHKNNKQSGNDFMHQKQEQKISMMTRVIYVPIEANSN